MADSYPYVLTNNKIEPIFSKIRAAAKPTKFTYEFLKQLGFSSTNDRAIIPLLKKLGFMTEDGVPTEYYDRLRDSSDWKFVLGEKIKDLYKDLFIIDTEIYTKTDDEIKGAISRITGKDEVAVARYFLTFKTLTTLAKFGQSPSLSNKEISTKETTDKVSDVKPATKEVVELQNEPRAISFQHNIEIHLPATTDISVYNAIFKSLRDNLVD